MTRRSHQNGGWTAFNPYFEGFFNWWKVEEREDAKSLLGWTVSRLKYFRRAELVWKIMPLTVFQSYVGISYGLFDASNPDFNEFLLVSVAMGLTTGSLSCMTVRETWRPPGEPNEAHQALVCKALLLLGRIGQLVSTVLAAAMHYCSYHDVGVSSAASGITENPAFDS